MNQAVVPRQPYRADVDGLRAVAVLLVLLFHFDLGFSGGFIGVDVFFVISGYLITNLIQKDLDNDRPLFLEFWSRRVIRILPALIVMIIAVLFVGGILLLPLDYAELGRSSAAQSLMIANVFFWATTGYFDSPVLTKPLLHTWSLAVEEQFYVALPLALYSLRGAALARRQLLLAVACLASFMVAVWWVARHPSAAFYLLPARAWELLLGSLVSTIQLSKPQQRLQAEAGSGLGVLLIIGSGFLYTKQTPFPGMAAVLPCLGTAMVIHANSQRATLIGSLLSSRPFLTIGLISYSLYLWHWPIYVFSTYWLSTPPTLGMRVFLAVASCAIAYLSWRHIESPFRRRAIWKSRKAIFKFAVGSLAMTGLLGAAIVIAKGVPGRIPPAAVEFASAKADAPYFQNVDLQAAKRHDFYRIGNRTSGPIDVLVWGDSHAMAIDPVLAAIANDCNLRIVGAHHASTAPLLGFNSKSPFSLLQDTEEFHASTMAYVRSEKIPVVLMIASWNGYIDDQITPMDGKALVKREFRESVFRTIKTLNEAGAEAWIMEMVPIYSYDVPRRLSAEAYFGGGAAQIGKSLVEHRRQSTFESAVFQDARALGARLLDPAIYLCPNGYCVTNRGGRSLYIDSNHLSLTGSALLRNMFEPMVRSIRPFRSDGTHSSCSVASNPAPEHWKP